MHADDVLRAPGGLGDVSDRQRRCVSGEDAVLRQKLLRLLDHPGTKFRRVCGQAGVGTRETTVCRLQPIDSAFSVT